MLLLCLVYLSACSTPRLTPSFEPTPPPSAKPAYAVSPVPSPTPPRPPSPTIPAPPSPPRPSDAPRDTVELVLAGDTMYDAGVRWFLDNNGGYLHALDESLQSLFAGADVTGVNLETSVSSRGEPEIKTYTYRSAPSKIIPMLKYWGVDYCSVANNHTLDFGRDAFSDTLDNLKAASIQFSGGGKNMAEAKAPAVFDIGGYKIAIVGVCRVMPTGQWYAGKNGSGLFGGYSDGEVAAAVCAAKEVADFCVVYQHWGEDAQAWPEPYQHYGAHAYIDAGADLVVGTHPHVVQGFEYYKGKPIAYSLGNFLMDGRLQTGCVLRVIIDIRTGEAKVTAIPIQRDGFVKIHPNYANVLAYLNSICFGAGVDLETGEVYGKPSPAQFATGSSLGN